MKYIRLVLAILAGLWTIGVAAGVVADLGKTGGTRGTTELVAGLAVTAGFAALTLWLFAGAVRRSKPNE
jgi:hypothetical protein